MRRKDLGQMNLLNELRPDLIFMSESYSRYLRNRWFEISKK